MFHVTNMFHVTACYKLLGWLGHVVRMKEIAPAKRAFPCMDVDEKDELVLGCKDQIKDFNRVAIQRRLKVCVTGGRNPLNGFLMAN